MILLGDNCFNDSSNKLNYISFGMMCFAIGASINDIAIFLLRRKKKKQVKNDL